ncbi:MAG: dihydroxyacetone kinase subunit DhaK [Firmicutes bacterium]|uniref:dihydroxyacetone kinase subunit DhaK n=1 Tax=Kallipyga massiliensis TaxID=1472764 RepID=UPI0026ECCBE7|nr:dihydroxyacetone kinase subunit DhaK [Kallipyga massiliensis]MDD7733062.1 dihydroxyacetone kinase subunit DhaK [Bacillota bacterium]
MKKLINLADNVVEEMIEGMVMAHPDRIKRVEGTNVLVRKDAPVDKVAVISGGGSGHEPAHAGFIGRGMLDGAVPGQMFTSPTPDQVLECIKATDSGKGVFMIVKNYTGDVMNFDMAAEMAGMEEIKVESVVVNDDVAVENSSFTTGRRGVAGTIFVEKILGAMAEEGKSLEEIKAYADKLIPQIKSMGMAIKACTVPSSGEESFHLEDDEMEIGIGIHGEPGIRKEALKPVKGIVEELMDKILAELDLSDGSEIALMVNGMGGTPLQELYVIAHDAHVYLKDKGIATHKTYVGDYMTSIDMAGFSLSVIKLDETSKKYLDAPADAIAWREV